MVGGSADGSELVMAAIQNPAYLHAKSSLYSRTGWTIATAGSDGEELLDLATLASELMCFDDMNFHRAVSTLPPSTYNPLFYTHSDNVSRNREGDEVCYSRCVSPSARRMTDEVYRHFAQAHSFLLPEHEFIGHVAPLLEQYLPPVLFRGKQASGGGIIQQYLCHSGLERLVSSRGATFPIPLNVYTNTTRPLGLSLWHNVNAEKEKISRVVNGMLPHPAVPIYRQAFGSRRSCYLLPVDLSGVHPARDTPASIQRACLAAGLVTKVI